MKKNRFFMLFAGAFISLMALTAFNSEVSAQSKNENIRYIINAVKEELGADDGCNVRSVTVEDNTVVVDVVSTDVPAELFCNLMHAVKSYMNDNDMQLSFEGKEFIDAFNAAGCKGVLIKVYDVGSNKSNNVNLTAKEFAAFSCMGDISDDSQEMMDVMSYLPIEDFVKIMDAGVKEEAGDEAAVVLENKVIFFIMQISADDLAEMWQVEEQYPDAMKEMMKMQMTENPDPSVAMIIEIARKHGCKFGFKFTAHGQKTLAVVLD